MNKKIILFFVFILILSVGFVSAHSSDSIKKDSGYEIMFLQKIWSNDTSDLRPDSVIIDIFANGELKRSVILTKDNNWEPYERVILPVYDDDGNEIDYTFEERGADNYNLVEVVKNDVLDYTLVNEFISSNNQTNITNNQTNNNTNINNQTNNQTNNNTNINNQTNNNTNNDLSNSSSNNQTHDVSHTKNKTSIFTPSSVKNVSNENKTVPMLHTGNAIWSVFICIILIVCIFIFKRR